MTAPEPVDLSTLTPEDVPPIGPSVVPDHRASRERRRGRVFGRGKAGERASDSPGPTRAPRRERENVPNRKGQFVKPLTNMYTMGGMAFVMRQDMVCGQAIIENAESCAKALDELAYRNDAVRRALYGLTKTSDLGMVLMAHMPIIVAVSTHHSKVAAAAMQNVAPTMVANLMKNDPTSDDVVEDEPPARVVPDASFAADPSANRYDEDAQEAAQRAAWAATNAGD